MAELEEMKVVKLEVEQLGIKLNNVISKVNPETDPDEILIQLEEIAKRLRTIEQDVRGRVNRLRSLFKGIRRLIRSIWRW